MKSWSLKCHMSHSIDCDYEVCQHHQFLANFSVSLKLSTSEHYEFYWNQFFDCQWHLSFDWICDTYSNHTYGQKLLDNYYFTFDFLSCSHTGTKVDFLSEKSLKKSSDLIKKRLFTFYFYRHMKMKQKTLSLARNFMANREMGKV